MRPSDAFKLFIMELVSQIDSLVGIVTSCTRATLNKDAYVAMVKQNYLPPASFEYLRSHWIPQECIRRSATWFKETVERLEIGIGDLGEVYVARSGFTLASLLLKYMLEYEYIELPGDVKSRLKSATVYSVDLDTLVGHVWPIIISADVNVLYVLKPLRERLGGLRMVKRLATPLVDFGVVSDILRASGMANSYFHTTGFGKLVNRSINMILENKSHVDLRDVAKSLVAVSRVHELMFQDLISLRRDWLEYVKWLNKRYRELGGAADLYTAEDVALDVIHFVLAAADHYNGDVEIRRLLHRLSWGSHLADLNNLKELIVRWFFARLVRIW